MELVIGAFAVLGLLFVAKPILAQRARSLVRPSVPDRHRCARAAAEILGLNARIVPGYDAFELSGQIGQVPLTIKFVAGPNAASHFVAFSGFGPLVLETRKAWLPSVDPACELVESGDAAFDSLFRIQDRSADHALAILDAAARKTLKALSIYDPVAREGQVTFVCSAFLTTEDIVTFARDAVRIAEALREPEDLSRALVQSVASDPEGEVRLNCLRAIQKTGTAALIAEANWAATRDADPRLKVAGANNLGADGVPVLVDVVKNEAFDDGIRTQALRCTAAIRPETATAMSRSLLHGPPGDLRAEAIDELGWLHVKEAANHLGRLVTSPDPRERRLVALSLGRIGVTESETSLFILLGDVDARVQLAAATALGACGTALAIEPLHELASRSPHSEDHAIVARAVEAIRSRLTGAEPGQLSLASGPAGGDLTLSPETEGGLSIPPPGSAIDQATESRASPGPGTSFRLPEEPRPAPETQHTDPKK